VNHFWKCFWYLSITGLVSFFIGRILPKKWFQAQAFPYHSYSFEKNGSIYEKLYIQKWQNKVPDMSKFFPRFMPAKNLATNDLKCLPRMIQETCVAEFIHLVLCATGLYCIELWPGMGGIIVSIVHIILFNVPFILIQRYNRPRLIKLQKMYERKQERKREGNEQICGC